MVTIRSAHAPTTVSIADAPAEWNTYVDAHADADRPLEAPGEREVLVVLAIPVAAAIGAVQHARRRGDRLRGATLHAHVDQEALRQLRVGEEVEFVADVAIRRPVVEAQIVEVERAIGERIALVRVVVFVLRQDVVRFELIPLRETFPVCDGLSRSGYVPSRGNARNAV